MSAGGDRVAMGNGRQLYLGRHRRRYDAICGSLHTLVEPAIWRDERWLACGLATIGLQVSRMVVEGASMSAAGDMVAIGNWATAVDVGGVTMPSAALRTPCLNLRCGGTKVAWPRFARRSTAIR